MFLRLFLQSFNNLLESVYGYRLQPSAETRLRSSRMKVLNEFSCNFVVDVGANIGQWAQDLRKSGYRGKILSFEPSNLFTNLQEKVKFDPSWEARPHALLDYEGTANFYHSSNRGLSSSTKKPNKILDHTLGIVFPETYQVSVARLDQELTDEENIYLKLDVQGAEMQVLIGAEGIIENISAIEFESAIVNLYEGESTHYELTTWLSGHDFIPYQLVITHWDSELRTISIDSIFVRNRNNQPLR
jgi:FkbM family methyltransferase